MRAFEEVVRISPPRGKSWITHLQEVMAKQIPRELSAVRFTAVAEEGEQVVCEVGVLEGAPSGTESVFAFVPGRAVPTKDFNVVMVVPTGVGAEVGGHAGDAAPAARLIGSVCDRLVTHPNVVNASDLNEMPANALYVEGSTLTRFLMGTVGLRPVRSNRILFVVESHPDKSITDIGINMFNGARASCGYDGSKVLVLEQPFTMEVVFSPISGRATGTLGRLDALISALKEHRREYDAVAITSRIAGITPEDYMTYVRGNLEGTVNPVGGVEAMLTHSVSHCLNVPSAHSPQLLTRNMFGEDVGLVEPSLAAEPACIAFVQCIFKGLHQSPRLVTSEAEMRHPDTLAAPDIACLVTPDRCLGLPVLAALERGIRVIAVRDRYNVMKCDLSKLPWAPGQFWYADGYLEAAGMLAAFRNGIAPETVRRPLHKTPMGRVS